MEWLIDIIKEWVIKQAYATEAWVLGKDYQAGADMPDWTMPLSVTGDLAPDATSTYLKTGTYNNKPYYRRQDGAYFIWWDGMSSWLITAEPPGTPERLWQREEPNVLGDYAPVPPITKAATVAIGYNYLKTSFVDRGDPAAYDKLLGDFTVDNTWRELDLSAIVPVGTTAITFLFWARSTLTGKEFSFRTPGNVNTKNMASLFSMVANLFQSHDLIVTLDEDRKVEYKASVGGWNYVALTVKGWWF